MAIYHIVHHNAIINASCFVMKNNIAHKDNLKQVIRDNQPLRGQLFWLTCTTLTNSLTFQLSLSWLVVFCKTLFVTVFNEEPCSETKVLKPFCNLRRPSWSLNQGKSEVLHHLLLLCLSWYWIWTRAHLEGSQLNQMKVFPVVKDQI